jgi:hypothetical protein
MLRVVAKRRNSGKGNHIIEMSTLIILCSCHVVDLIRPRVPTVPSGITASTLPRLCTKIKRRPSGPVVYNFVLVRLWYNVRIDVT